MKNTICQYGIIKVCIIIFIFDNAHSQNFDLGTASLISYNVTQDTLIYETESFDKLGSILLPQIHNNKVYVAFAFNLYCFDLYTGKPIWHKDFPGGEEHLATARFTLHDDMLILKMPNNGLYALNANSGGTIWFNEKGGFNPSSLITHKNHVYYTGGRKLYAVNLDNGEVVWEYEPTPRLKDNINASFDNGVAIDEDLGFLYVADGVYLYAVKLIE